MRAIAAMSLNRVIGKDGDIPWRVKEDFKYFKEKTLNQKIVMGRTTFEGVGPLPNREIYVLSHRFPDPYFESNLDLQSMDRTNTKVIPITKLTEIPSDSWICGGASLYEQTLEMCTDVYMTIVHKEVEGDVFMPYFESDFNLVWSHETESTEGTKLTFQRYTNSLINSFNPLNHEQSR
jgi:dihydrofolate reductase